MTDDHQLQGWWAKDAHLLLLHTHTHTHTRILIHSTQYSVWPSATTNRLTGWNRLGLASRSESILLCMPACMHLFDVDWWRAVSHKKEDVSMHSLRSLPYCLHSGEPAVSISVCVRCMLDVCPRPCFGRKWLWEEQQYARQSISSNISPVESTWWCCYWQKCVAALVFLCNDIFWHQLVSY